MFIRVVLSTQFQALAIFGWAVDSVVGCLFIAEKSMIPPACCHAGFRLCRAVPQYYCGMIPSCRPPPWLMRVSFAAAPVVPTPLQYLLQITRNCIVILLSTWCTMYYCDRWVLPRFIKQLGGRQFQCRGEKNDTTYYTVVEYQPFFLSSLRVHPLHCVLYVVQYLLDKEGSSNIKSFSTTTQVLNTTCFI